MPDLDKYLNMLKSEDADTRFDACDELCVAAESSPEIILALEEATQDEDREVAERARQALGTEVHSQMALKMGRVPPRKTNQEAIVLAVRSLFLGVFTYVFIGILLFLLIDGEAFGKEGGIAMIFICGSVFILIAVVLSALALIRIIKNRESNRGLGIAILSLIVTVLAALFYLWSPLLISLIMD